MADTPTHEALRDSANQAIDAYFDRFTTATGQLFGPIDAEMRALRHFAALAAADAALSVQAEPVATVTECEACFTPDVCQLRGTCNHYAAERLRVAATPQPPAPVPAVPHQVIAGALFDFLGFLTTRDEVTPFGSSAEAAPAVDLLTAWAKTSGLHLNEADVHGWRNNITGAPDHG